MSRWDFSKAVGFFEDFFNGRPKAVVTYWHIANQHLLPPSKTGLS